VDTGITVPGSGQYVIPPQDYDLWASSSDVVAPIGLTTLVVNDGSGDLNPSDGIDLIKGIFPSTVIVSSVTDPVTVDSITNPVTVDSILTPVLIDDTDPVNIEGTVFIDDTDPVDVDITNKGFDDDEYDRRTDTIETLIQCMVDEQKQTNKLLRLILGYDLDADF
jgi:hypothetical protein